MPNRDRPTLNVTVDADIRAELDRLKREESVNVSSYVNGVLRMHFITKPRALVARTGKK